MKYKIVEKDSGWGLIIEVEDLIKKGWKPLGGVAVMYCNGLRVYVQALTKE